MGIKVIQSMDVRASVPLDSRAVVQNLTDLPQYKLYEGLLVYQRSNKKYYKYEDSAFVALSEALGVNSFNDAVGNVSIVPGPGIKIQELELRKFTISADGVLFTDGSNGMAINYVPTEPTHVITKQYLEDSISNHANIRATKLISGHIKIDDVSIKQNDDDEIYVDTINGGVF